MPLDTSALFKPIQVGTLTVSNRLFLTSTHLGKYGLEPARYVSNICSYIEARAEGGAGAIILTALGSANIDLHPPEGTAPEWYRTDAEVFAAIVATAHRHGVPIGMQLQHKGARSAYAEQPRWAPSPVPVLPGDSAPQELSDEQIEEIIQIYGERSLLVKKAGFDFIEIHAGHGYLVNEFLSPRGNRRMDSWGGLKGGIRFLQRIVSSVRGSVGPEIPVSLRVSGSERAAGGLEAADMKTVISEVVPGGIDLLNVSGGTAGSHPGIVATYLTPYGFNVADAAELKKEVTIPVLAVGRLWDPQLMVDTISEGRADIIGLARPLWADPELPNKLRHNRLLDIRPAIGCNQGCIDRADDETRTCLVNPAFGRERELRIRPAAKVKRVAVIGGGVAGLEAARVAARRGHQVTVFEQAAELGGRWRLASRARSKAEFARFLEWLVRDTLASGTDIKLASHFDPADHRPDDWDTVVVATGGRFEPASLAGRPVMTPDQAIGKYWLTGHRVLVAGPDRLHIEAALYLSSLGREVTLAADHRNLCPEVGPTTRLAILATLAESRVVVDCPTAAPDWDCFDSIVALGSSHPADALWEMCLDRFAEAHVIGDARQPRSGLEAVADGALLGREL